MRSRTTVGLAAVAAIAMIVAPGVLAGKKPGVVKDKKGDAPKSAPGYTDIVKAKATKSGSTLTHKIKVAKAIPKEIPDNFPIGVAVYDGSGTSYFDTYGQREGMKIKRKGKKAIKIVLTKDAVGKPKSPRWFAYAGGSKFDRAPDGNGHYAKYKK